MVDTKHADAVIENLTEDEKEILTTDIWDKYESPSTLQVAGALGWSEQRVMDTMLSLKSKGVVEIPGMGEA